MNEPNEKTNVLPGLLAELRAELEDEVSETKHTPLPWTAHEHGGCFYVFGPGQAMVADGDTEEAWLTRIRGVGRGATPEEQRANAEFIVRACNSHEALFAACRGLLNETLATLSLAREAIVEVAGNTNMACLERRCVEAQAVLSRAEGRS